ncbi:cyclic GMP-AMP synthase-like receptor 1 isoform X2 [Haliotis asinina]|uniref:cyclic GMP-AMP synthase-like receptor 1 isoform X2 n=1 Tax=Haliotis asinina TaxID=109174 RepID=UPI003531DF10
MLALWMDTERMQTFVQEMVRKGIIHHPERPKTNLRDFLEKEVTLDQDEISEISNHFNELRSDVIQYLNQVTPWTWKTFSAGSYYDGTKVSRPNEMDCQLIPRLRDSVTPIYERCEPGHCRLKVKYKTNDPIHTLCDEGCINMDRFRSYFFDKMEKFQSQRRIKKDLTYPQSPSYRVIYTTTQELPNIEIDFVAALHVDKWPDFPFANNLKEKLSSDLPREIDPEEIMREGSVTVMKHCKADVPDKALQWKMSFTYAEKSLSKHADKKSWKPIIRIIKRAKEIAKGDTDVTKTNVTKQLRKAAKYTKENLFPDSDGKLGVGTYPIRMLMWTLMYDKNLGLGNTSWQDRDTLDMLHVCLRCFRLMLTGKLQILNLFMPQMGDIMRTVRLKDRHFMYVMTLVIDILFSEAE